jgi:hypothetical protein
MQNCCLTSYHPSFIVCWWAASSLWLSLSVAMPCDQVTWRLLLIPSTPKKQIGFTKGVRRKENRGTLAPSSPGVFLVSNFVAGKAHGQGVTRIRGHRRQQPRAARTS